MKKAHVLGMVSAVLSIQGAAFAQEMNAASPALSLNLTIPTATSYDHGDEYSPESRRISRQYNADLTSDFAPDPNRFNRTVQNAIRSPAGAIAVGLTGWALSEKDKDRVRDAAEGFALKAATREIIPSRGDQTGSPALAALQRR